MPNRLLRPHRVIPLPLHRVGGILVPVISPAAAAQTGGRKSQKKSADDGDSKQSLVASDDPWTAHTGLDNCLDGNSRSLYVSQSARCRMATPPLPPTTPASAGLLLTIAAHMLFSGWSCADALTKGGSLRPNLFRKAAAA